MGYRHAKLSDSMRCKDYYQHGEVYQGWRIMVNKEVQRMMLVVVACAFVVDCEPKAQPIRHVLWKWKPSRSVHLMFRHKHQSHYTYISTRKGN
jgi:hypothetical protein